MHPRRNWGEKEIGKKRKIKLEKKFRDPPTEKLEPTPPPPEKLETTPPPPPPEKLRPHPPKKKLETTPPPPPGEQNHTRL